LILTILIERLSLLSRRR